MRAAALDAFSSPLLAGPALIRACRQAGVLRGRPRGRRGDRAARAAASGCRTAAGALSLPTAGDCRRRLDGRGRGYARRVAAGAGGRQHAHRNRGGAAVPRPRRDPRRWCPLAQAAPQRDVPDWWRLAGARRIGDGREELDYENLLHNLRVAAAVVPALAELRVAALVVGVRGGRARCAASAGAAAAPRRRVRAGLRARRLLAGAGAREAAGRADAPQGDSLHVDLFDPARFRS